MKQSLSTLSVFVLFLLLVFSFSFSMPAFAAEIPLDDAAQESLNSPLPLDDTESVTVTAGTVTVEAGKEVAMPVSVSGTGLNIYCFELYLTYDTDLLEPVYTSATSHIMKAESLLPDDYMILASAENGVCHVVADGLNTPITESGEILKLYFKAKETAGDCTAQVTATVNGYSGTFFATLSESGLPAYINAAKVALEKGSVSVTGERALICRANGLEDSTVSINGKEYSFKDGSFTLPDAKSLIVSSYSYFVADKGDAHKNYPDSIGFYKLAESNAGGYVLEKLEQLDGCLACIGASIRSTGNQGMRIVYSIPQTIMDALTSEEGLNGYILEEVGTVAAWASSTTDPTLETKGAMSAYAYSREQSYIDNELGTSNGVWQYANAFTFTNMERAKADLAIRPYMILSSKETGEKVTLYGGVIIRNIGYVAYQNILSGDKTEFLKTIFDYVYPNGYKASEAS